MMPPDAPKLGILAGGGDLPRLLIQACQKTGRDVFVIAFKDQCDAQTVADVAHVWVRLGAAGKALEALKDHAVVDLVMAGRIRRPSLAALMPDARAVRFLAGGVMNRGDDGVLRTIVSALEREEGFHMVGAHEVLPELLSPQGVMGQISPSADDQVDIDAAVHAALALGGADQGQAAVAQGGHVVALEDLDGTDAMLKRCAHLNAPNTGGVLAKMAKPGQDRRADLPTIGLATVEHAFAAGLKGIVVEAGGSIIVAREAVIKAADDKGLFLLGVKP